MKKNLANNGRATATTRSIEPPNGPRDEAALYSLEGRIAAAASKQAASEVLKSLLRAADPKAWTERYPLPAVGAAAVTGFLLSSGFLSGKRKEAKHAPPPAPAEASQASESWWGTLLAFGLALLKNAVVPILREAVQPRAKTSSSE